MWVTDGRPPCAPTRRRTVPETVFGLPTHAIVVHATVVFLPLAALAVLLHAFWPEARRRLGIVTPILAGIALVLVPLSTQSGEGLEHSVGESALVEKHAELADGMLPWAIGLFVVAVGAVAAGPAPGRRARRRRQPRPLGADRRRRPGGGRRRRHRPAGRPGRSRRRRRRPGTASCRRPPPGGDGDRRRSGRHRDDVRGAPPGEGDAGTAVAVAGDHRPAVDGRAVQPHGGPARP